MWLVLEKQTHELPVLSVRVVLILMTYLVMGDKKRSKKTRTKRYQYRWTETDDQLYYLSYWSVVYQIGQRQTDLSKNIHLSIEKQSIGKNCVDFTLVAMRGMEKQMGGVCGIVSTQGWDQWERVEGGVVCNKSRLDGRRLLLFRPTLGVRYRARLRQGLPGRRKITKGRAGRL